MIRQLIVSLAVFAIMPGVFFYQPTTDANAAQFDASNSTQLVAQAEEPAGEHKDVPWVPILILALIIPTAALLIPSFYMARRPEEGDGPPG